MGSRVVAARSPLVVAAAVGVGTYLLVRATLELLVLESIASPLWWPITAAVVAVMVRCPRRWWWGVIVGSSLGVVMAAYGEVGLVLSLTYMTANAVEALVASFILADLRNYHDGRLHVLRNAARFSIAAVGAVGAGAIIISISATVFPADSLTYGLLGGYAVNHLLGYLTVAPLLLPEKLVRGWALWSGVEFVAVVLAVGAMSLWSLMQVDSDGRAFVMLAPVMWSAVRFDAARATAVSALTCALAAYATAHGRGPFAVSADLLQRQLVTEIFILGVTASTMGLVLVMRHRAQLATAAQDSARTLRVAIRDALIGMYSIRLDAGRVGEIRDVNTALCTLLGFRPDQLIGRHCGILGACGDPEQERILQSHLDRFVDRTMTTLREESTFRTVDGGQRWVELNLSVVDSVGVARFVLVHVHDLTERENAKRSLERMALRDPLTGLANRTLLFQRIGEVMEAAHADCRMVGLLYLDLDGFKQVNDTHGHDAGDAVLVAIARRMTGAVRQDSTVARLGGDEFAIVCPNDDTADDKLTELTVIADRIRKLLREPIHVHVASEAGRKSGTEVTVDVSIGIGTARGNDTADDLIRAADQAMYAVKQGRRSRRL
ncbi:MAG: diguanylate cyclase [Nakamurella sp.]